MGRYLISDHHFGHSNIIDYCDRPFTSVGAMDNALLDRHYGTVGVDDVLVHLGDVAMDMRDGRTTIEYFEQLGGDLLIAGNHDVGLDPDAAPFPVLDACVLERRGHSFYCTHRPEDVPDAWDGWVIHGHIHNNDLERFPFLAYDDKRVNVSAEVLGYRPIGLDVIADLVEAAAPGDRLRLREDAVDGEANSL
ncbi:metallophosphoesterase [Halobellus sp. GM3]|uniref:metallophosphoesterase n=1 Tax=Halobellus sp. GM3 TaxID=3458410 RepID=UPI00403E2259